MASVSNYINYTAAGTTEAFHNTPRFGHGNDFAVLFSRNRGAQNDYLGGVVFVGMLILSFFFVWLVVLLIFKCLGEKVGFLSGARMVLNSNERGCTRPVTVRALFCLSTLTVIAFTIVLVKKGLKDLKNTTDSLDQSNAKVAQILDQFQSIATDLRTVGTNANETRSQIVQQLDNFCPNAQLLPQGSANLLAAAQGTSYFLKQLGDFIAADVSDAQKALTQAQNATQDLDEALGKVDFRRLAISFIIIYIVLPSCIMIGVLLAWLGWSNPCIQCMLSWLVLPVWLLMVLVAILSTALTSWMAVANADFCSGGQAETPDATVKNILDNQKVDQTTFLGKVVYFYVTQCLTSDPWSFVRGFEANLTSANATISTLSSQISDIGLNTLSNVCGQDYAPFSSLLVAMELTLSTLVKDAVLTLKLLSCDNIVPIYTNTAYATSCQYSISALSWSFSSFLVISFFGMMMITLRSAWHDVKYMDDDEPKNVTQDSYLESAAPDDEDQPPHWNSYEKAEPVADYGDSPRYDEDRRDNNDNNYNREKYAENDLSLNQDDDDNRHIVYHDEPPVVQAYEDKQYDSNGMYRPNVY